MFVSRHSYSYKFLTEIVPSASAWVLFALLLLPRQGMAQDTGGRSFRFEFLPTGLNFPPLHANTQEARIGVFKFLDESNMKVDIGNTMDIFGYQRADSSLNLTAGIDFMGYALTTGNQGLRLQIDALDGFFGGNLAISKSILSESNSPSGVWRGRLRLLHHSAHLVDGAYNRTAMQWANNRVPVPYTRDFGELVISRESPRVQLPWNFRLYGGFSYATLVRPTSINRMEYLAGAELYSPLGFGNVAKKPVNIYGAINTSLMSTGVYASSNQVQIGIKFGEWYGKGPAVFLAYYQGRQMFAEYYDLNIATISAGFTVDF